MVKMVSNKTINDNETAALDRNKYCEFFMHNNNDLTKNMSIKEFYRNTSIFVTGNNIWFSFILFMNYYLFNLYLRWYRSFG